MMIGNFKSDAATNSVIINPTNLPLYFTDILYDDVSVIDIDLPAFAGYDYYQAPGDSAFIGRTPDVGINEACTWFLLPNMATPIATIAGMYVQPTVTSTYVVRQEICGVVKWDTVVVFQSGVGLRDEGLMMNDLRLYPVPASDELSLELKVESWEKESHKLTIVNGLGQLVREEEISFKNRTATLKTGDLPEGVYLLRLHGSKSGVVSRRFVIAR